jgi:AcrR family transcriptional regulator
MFHRVPYADVWRLDPLPPCVNTHAYSHGVALTKTPPEAWVDAAFEALATGGPDAVRVEALAATLSVTKGGFYWHFQNRNDLLDRMLTEWEQAVVDTVIATIDSRGSNPRDKLRELLEIAIAFGLAGHGLEVEIAIRDWARRDKAVADRLHRVDERRMTYLRALFGQFCADEADTEARCLIVYALFVSNPLIGFQHPGRSREDVIRDAMDLLLA